MAAGLLLSAGVVALSHAVRFSAAALAFGALSALLALATHPMGRARSARAIGAARDLPIRIQADLAVVCTLANSARPMVPLAAFLAAFVLAWRR